jgi:glutamine amidotransferase
LMKKSVTIVDYGIGNLLSIMRAFEACGADSEIVGDPNLISSARRLALPGVGAFGDCMRALERCGLAEAVLNFARSGRPMIGICVGMQMLFEASEEFGEHHGLGLLKGRVVRIPDRDTAGHRHKIPHIGWTEINVPQGCVSDRWKGSVLDAVSPGASMYFVHSFTAQPENSADRLADAYYGGHVVSAAVRRDNVTGTQFHPEKSGPAGLSVIRGFLT